MNETQTQLALIKRPLPQPIELFNADKAAIDEVIQMVRAEISAFDYGDFAVKKNRDAVKSLAYKVAQTKTAIDNSGKDFLADVKAKVKTIDDVRKYARDELDKLRDKAKQPLIEWEQEQERIRQEEERIEIQKEIDKDHEFALLMDKEWQAEQERIKAAQEEAQRVAAELAEKKRQEELAAAAEAAKIKTEAEAAAEIERARQAQKEAEERAAREKHLAEQRAIQAEQEAKRREEQARIDAQNKAAAEQAAKEKAEQEERERIEVEEKARQANIEHRRTVNNEILTALTLNGLTEEQAKVVITLAAKRSGWQIDH